MSAGRPISAQLGGHKVTSVDVEEVKASLVFDVSSRSATAVAAVRFSMPQDGFPALDLRQTIDSLELDGHPLDPDCFVHQDLGGGAGAEMRVLEHELRGAGRYELRVVYELGTPRAEGAEAVGWQSDGVRFDLWMSDLKPGRYLEMWVPAGLCDNRFSFDLHLEVVGTDRRHILVTNEMVSEGLSFDVRYPRSYTSLSPMCVLAPADQVQLSEGTVALAHRERPLRVVAARHVDINADLEACVEDIRAWLSFLGSRYGPWAFGPQYTAFVWGSGRGMEYDGATTACVGAIEHEVFHSWFGRGVKPASASDGWIDEAWTSWATSTRRMSEGRFAEVDLGLDEDPVLLYPPHPWSRHTPVESYAKGARLFAGVAHLLGGADRLRSAMASWYRDNTGGLVTTDGLERHLTTWSGVDISPWWQRYVHGAQ